MRELATQELAMRSAADRYQEELNARIVDQQREIKETKTKKQDEIADLEKEQEENIDSMEKNLKDLGNLKFCLKSPAQRL